MSQVLAQSLAVILDAVSEKRRDTNDRSQDHFHPSTIGYCARKTVMERLGYAKKLHDARAQRIFDNGHSVHERITQELREAGVLIREEVPIAAPDRNLSGHTDGIGLITVAEQSGQMVILEIKSIGEKGYRWIVGGGDKFYKEHGADDKHKQQVQLYMYMTGLNLAIIIYENKNTQERAYYVEAKNDDLLRSTLLPKVSLINEHVELKTLPPRDSDHPPTCFECKYCDYEKPCLEEELKNL